MMYRTCKAVMRHKEMRKNRRTHTNLELGLLLLGPELVTSTFLNLRKKLHCNHMTDMLSCLVVSGSVTVQHNR